jgi:hypothetical protein
LQLLSGLANFGSYRDVWISGLYLEFSEGPHVVGELDGLVSMLENFFSVSDAQSK